MKGAWGFVFVTVTAISSTGCGTVCNFAGVVAPYDKSKEYPMVYGGVQLDKAVLLNPGSSPIGGAGFLCWLLIDFPVSLVGDTLTLPLTYGIEQLRKAHPEDEKTANPFPMGHTPSPPESLESPEN